MLVESQRITASDLELWEEFLELDILHASSPTFVSRCEITMKLICDFVHRRNDYFVAVSWGKDSVVLADMFYRSGARPKHVYVRNLAREIPENLSVRDAFLKTHDIDYREIEYNYSNADDSYFNRKGEPAKWQNVLRNLKKQYGCHVTGIRYDESAKRKRRYLMHGIETEFSFAPFRHFDVKDIFAYLYKHDLPVHPNYAMLGGGLWNKYRLRVAAIGNKEGDGMGRTEWEREYYADVLNRVSAMENATLVINS